MADVTLVSYVLRAKNRYRVLVALDSLKEKISAQIETETRMYKSHASRTLKELQEKGLVNCVNPQDRSYRFYKISAKGKEILKKAKHLKEHQTDKK